MFNAVFRNENKGKERRKRVERKEREEEFVAAVG